MLMIQVNAIGNTAPLAYTANVCTANDTNRNNAQIHTTSSSRNAMNAPPMIFPSDAPWMDLLTVVASIFPPL